MDKRFKKRVKKKKIATINKTFLVILIYTNMKRNVIVITEKFLVEKPSKKTIVNEIKKLKKEQKIK